MNDDRLRRLEEKLDSVESDIKLLLKEVYRLKGQAGVFSALVSIVVSAAMGALKLNIK